MPDRMTLIASTLIISLAACGENANVNPPTEPVAGEAMTLSWLDRDTAPTTLVRCPVIGADVPAA